MGSAPFQRKYGINVVFCLSFPGMVHIKPIAIKNCNGLYVCVILYKSLVFAGGAPILLLLCRKAAGYPPAAFHVYIWLFWVTYLLKGCPQTLALYLMHLSNIPIFHHDRRKAPNIRRPFFFAFISKFGIFYLISNKRDLANKDTFN